MLAGSLGWDARLPMTLVLHEWDSVATVVVTHTYENWCSLACDEYVFFAVDCDPILGEYRYSPVIHYLAHAHERLWEFVEYVCFVGTFGQAFKR